MKLEALQENLKRGLGVVMPAVAGKSTLPVLSHIQLTADNTGLWLAATNLECGIRTRIGARVEVHGAVCLPAKLLGDLIGGLPNVPVNLELNDRNQVVTIRAGKFNTELHGIEADEFPVLVTTAGDALFSMPGSDWHTVAAVVAPCASTEIGRAVLQGVHMFSGKAGITFEAADSYRLARKTFALDDTVFDTLIPATSLLMARKVFSADADVAFSVVNSGNMAVFTSESTTMSSRVLDGQYPDCDRWVPKDYNTRIILPSADLLSTVRLAKPFAEASSNIIRLDLAETDNDTQQAKLGILARAAEIGEHSSVLDVLATGKPNEIALNVHYLMDALAACGAGDVAIEMQDPTRPAVMRSVGDESMLQLLMPVTKH